MNMYKIHNTSERVKFMREAADVSRLHTKRYIGEYTNGQHTFNMLAMLRLLWPEAPVGLIWAIIEHDLPEKLISDIASPSIHFGGFVDKEKLQDAERAILNELMPEGYYFTGETAEYRSWLKGLDLLELYLFCRDQRRLGNNNLVQVEHRCVEVFKFRTSEFPQEIMNLFYECKLDVDWHPLPDLGTNKNGEKL